MYFPLVTLPPAMLASAGMVQSDTAGGAWFNIEALPVLIGALISVAIVLYTTYHRRSRERFTMREINGLAAVEEAIGRATEMARPILFTPGWGGDIQRPTTIASMNILSHVAYTTASYDCELVYPTHDPVIMSVAQEVVEESYARAGYPDRFVRDNIRYVSSSQFGYAAAVDGLISRHKPASVSCLVRSRPSRSFWPKPATPLGRYK